MHIHSGLAKSKFLHAQSEMRTLWIALILGWRNLGLAFPERDANPMVHTRAGLAKPSFCIPGTKYEPYGAHSFCVGET